MSKFKAGDRVATDLPETHAQWSRRIGHHCGQCGNRWPRDSHGRPVRDVFCPSCGSLPCRADTTDPVAPDPPCAGYRVTHAAIDAYVPPGETGGSVS